MKIQHTTETTFLTVSKIQSIRTKILIFALLATILPALVLGWLSYLQSSKLLREKIANELNSATDQASGKLDEWLKARFYDLRVFSSSYIISENLSNLVDHRHNALNPSARKEHIRAYLKSVADKFTLYDNLMLIDKTGVPIVTDSDNLSDQPLPQKWLELLKSDIPDGRNVQFPSYANQEFLFIAEAVRASDGSILGLLGAKINLNAIRTILRRQTMGGIDEIYVLDNSDRLLVSTSIEQTKPPHMTRLNVNHGIVPKIVPNNPVDYISHHKRAVVGTAVPISLMQWRMVAEMEKERAYEEIDAIRRITATLVTGLMLIIGIMASFFGHRLVAPLRRLSREAAKVASGDLDVDIPVSGRSEVSYLTQVFNHMVANLRRNREELSSANNALRETNEELHQISITDGLTGLYNRKHITELLVRETSRSQRSGGDLSILMIDIDDFKKVNDTYGHPVGDTVMRQLAKTLTVSVRDCDHVGRYGGEEFAVILPESSVADAASTAERIRANVGNLQFVEGQENFSVTISVGVAGFLDHGENSESLLGHADKALYQAKAEGRNKVVTAEMENRSGMATVHQLPRAKCVSNGQP